MYEGLTDTLTGGTYKGTIDCLEYLMMRGLMQDWPLTLNRIIQHAAKWHGDREDILY
jgi:hypothetical protein